MQGFLSRGGAYSQVISGGGSFILQGFFEGGRICGYFFVRGLNSRVFSEGGSFARVFGHEEINLQGLFGRVLEWLICGVFVGRIR